MIDSFNTLHRIMEDDFVVAAGRSEASRQFSDLDAEVGGRSTAG